MTSRFTRGPSASRHNTPSAFGLAGSATNHIGPSPVGRGEQPAGAGRHHFRRGPEAGGFPTVRVPRRAHQFCDAQSLPRIGTGLPSPYAMQIRNLRNQLVSQGLSQPQMDQLAHDAVAAYCPDRMP